MTGLYRKLLRITFFLAALPPLTAVSQDNHTIDSLQNALAAAGPRESIDVLTELAAQYYFSDLKKSAEYALDILEKSASINYRKGSCVGYNILGYLLARQGKNDSAISYLNKSLQLAGENYASEKTFALYWLGTAYQQKTDYPNALQYMQESLQLSESAASQKDVARAHRGLGIVYYSQSKYNEALEHYLKADSLMKNEKMSIAYGDLLQNIGLVYHVLDIKKPEQEYYHRSLKIYEVLNDEYGISMIELRLGNFEKEAGRWEQAKNHFLNALPYFEKTSDQKKIGEIYNYLGSVYLRSGVYDQAERYYKKAIPILERTESATSLTNAYLGIGATYNLLRRDSLALQFLNKASLLAEQAGGLYSKDKILEELSRYYAANENYKEAYEIQLEHKEIADSLSRARNSEVMHEMEAKYQNERKQREIEALSAQNQVKEQKAAAQRNLFFLALVFMLLLAGVFYALYRTKQKANARLRTLDELKSRFFANISHEFRTPLTLIAGPVENWLKTKNADDAEREALQMIQRNSARLLALVDQLLELSKLESGSASLRVGPGNLSVFLGAIASSFKYQAQEKQIEYEIRIDEAPDESWFDGDALQKIVVNLLSNAFKYTPEHGIISFAAGFSSGYLKMAVKNSGPGIAGKDLKFIFDRFYQVNGAGGAGVGLALVKELAGLYRGRVDAASEPGKTTTFTVSLPIRKEAFRKHELGSAEALPHTASAMETPESPQSEPAAEPADEGAATILVVEDNADIRTFIKGLLGAEYVILEAADGRAGIAAALRQIPDLILSDVMMIGADGIELCRKLKADERTSHIPIILLTAKAGDVNKLIGLETGADDYITKPFSGEILKTRIRKLIELRKRLHSRYSREVVLKPKEIAITSADQRFLEKVQRILDEKLTDSAFNTEAFSREIGMSRMNLHRKLKALTGVSTNVFIRTERLKLAAALLASPGVNISEVGYLAGFSDPSYFAKCFKELYQCTPSEYVSRARIPQSKPLS